MRLQNQRQKVRIRMPSDAYFGPVFMSGRYSFLALDY